MKYELIIFDADQTLFDFKKSEKHAFKNTMLDFGFDYDEDYHFRIYKEINTAIWIDLEKGLITQKKLKTERFKRFSDKIKSNIDVIEFAKSYMKNLSEASFLYDYSMELIENLHTDYKLMIITNGLLDVQHKRIRQSPIAEYFDEIVISDEINISKPDPRIFDFAMKDYDSIEKNKILIIGDSLTSDIQGGINFGIDTCWYNPNNQLNVSNIIPNYDIRSMKDLNSVLERYI